MSKLYILKSLKNGYIYVGVTSDLEKRLERHNGSQVVSTKKHAPYELVYSEQHPDLVSARRREKFLKAGDGRRVLKSILDSLR